MRRQLALWFYPGGGSRLERKWWGTQWQTLGASVVGMAHSSCVLTDRSNGYGNRGNGGDCSGVKPGYHRVATGCVGARLEVESSIVSSRRRVRFWRSKYPGKPMTFEQEEDHWRGSGGGQVGTIAEKVTKIYYEEETGEGCRYWKGKEGRGKNMETIRGYNGIHHRCQQPQIRCRWRN